MIALLRKLFWVVLFCLSTFCFYVLFEHGTGNFPDNARSELDNLKVLYEKQQEKSPDSGAPKR